MNNGYRRGSSFRIPGYSENAVLQLVAASFLGYVLVNAVEVTLIVFGKGKGTAEAMAWSLAGLPSSHQLASHWWTPFIYGWAHKGFWELLSNMIWLYTFGSIVQTLVGHRQVIPIFIYGLLTGAACYLGVQLIPGLVVQQGFLVMTASGGVMAMAAAAVTLSPRYRYYLGENLGIPLLVIAGIYLALNVVSYATSLPLLALCAGGALAGWGTIRLLQRGYNPGRWMYGLGSGIGGAFTPDEVRLRAQRNRRRQQTIQLTRKQAEKAVTQHRVDEILDKIHQRGYESLTQEEREMLMKASKEEAE